MSEELQVFAKKRKTKLIFRILLIGALIALMLGGVLYLLLTRFFVVKEFAIGASEVYTEEEIIEKLAIPKGKPLISLSKKEICRKVEESFPYLLEVKVSFSLPGTVKVSFREDFGKLALNLGAEVFSIDRDLNVLSKEDPETAIPRIRLYSDDVVRCVVGEKLSFDPEKQADTFDTLLEMIRVLEEGEMLDDVQSIDLRDKFKIKVRYLDRFDILVGEKNDLKQKFAMVRQVVADLSETQTGSIDISDPNTAWLSPDEPIE